MGLTRIQCKKCPWKKSTNPHDIPNGYSVEAHAALKNTITSGLTSLMVESPVMACHEYPKGGELPCVGWMAHQLRENNIGLRIKVVTGRIAGNVRTVGPQHRTFEQTLPVRK